MSLDKVKQNLALKLGPESKRWVRVIDAIAAALPACCSCRNEMTRLHLKNQHARASGKKVKIGVCGEHGGDAPSVIFFHGAGADYVSCSPYRVPVARLAAAHAALDTGTGGSGTA